MAQTKSQFREEFLNKRKALPFSFIQEASRKIFEGIISSKEFQTAQTISSYYPFRNEVDLLCLVEFSPTKTIVFPRVVKGTTKLDFYSVKSLNNFGKGVFGLMEPKLFLPKIEIEKIDLFLVPGLAFTKSGDRLGYGGGYYDETLRHKKPSSKTMGVSFDIQIADSLPNDPWDLKLDFIATETTLYTISTTENL